MDDSIDQTIGQQRLNQAQERLAKIQKKIKEFKKQAKVIKRHEQPIPDLANYITFFKQKRQMFEQNNQKMGSQFAFINKQRQKEQQEHFRNNFKSHQKQNIQSDNYSQRFLEQKNKTLDKMETFYNERNLCMDKKIEQLQLQKDKLKKDKELLIRNNQQIQDAILLQKQMFQNNSKKQVNSSINQLILKIQETKRSISKIQKENSQIQNRKKQLQTHIRQCIKSQRDLLKRDLQINKSKSKPTYACQYH